MVTTGTLTPDRRLAWLLPVAIAFHELEEWNIAVWYQRHWTNVDLELVNHRNTWTWLAFAGLLGFAWTFLATRFRNTAIRFRILLVLFIPVASHCILHIYWTFSLGLRGGALRADACSGHRNNSNGQHAD